MTGEVCDSGAARGFGSGRKDVHGVGTVILPTALYPALRPTSLMLANGRER